MNFRAKSNQIVFAMILKILNFRAKIMLDLWWFLLISQFSRQNLFSWILRIFWIFVPKIAQIRKKFYFNFTGIFWIFHFLNFAPKLLIKILRNINNFPFFKHLNICAKNLVCPTRFAFLLFRSNCCRMRPFPVIFKHYAFDKKNLKSILKQFCKWLHPKWAWLRSQRW